MAHAARLHELQQGQSRALVRQQGNCDACSLAWTLLCILDRRTAQLITYVLRVAPGARGIMRPCATLSAAEV